MVLTEEHREKIRGACSAEVYERANYFALRCHRRLSFVPSDFDPADIVHTALVKILDGDRRWHDEHLEFSSLLFGVVSSLYSSLAKQRRVRQEGQQKILAEPPKPFKQTYDRVEELQQRYSYLKAQDPELAHFFFKANHLIHMGKCETASDIAKEFGISPAAVVRKKKAIARIMEQWSISTETSAKREEE